MPNKLWVESYRPQSISDYVFQTPKHKELVEKWIKEESIPHLILSGHRGTGKTSLAWLLKNELDVEDGDFKVLNASDDNSVDIIRNDIKSFAQTMPLGDFKIVFFDEADYLSQNAQAALRNMMERYSDTVRFILTCNKPHKIIPEIRESRCQELVFKEFDRNEMAIHAIGILRKEGVKIRDAELIEMYVDDCYPDMRKLLQSMESNVVDGELQDPMDTGDTSKVLVSIVDQLSKGKWLEVRENIVKNVEDSEWENIYRFLYDNLDQVEGFDDTNNWKKGIVIIADHLRFHFQIADAEINFTACMIRLSGVLK